MTTYDFFIVSFFILLISLLTHAISHDKTTKAFKWLTGFSEYQFPEDYYLSFKQRVKNAGYKFEEYEVDTKDGFILKIFRINKHQNNTPNGVVFLQHGLWGLADEWINNFDEKAPGFMLAKEGYDVWLGNNRGNAYSYKHKTLDPSVDKQQYYNFSFEELGHYDLPGMINKVIEITNADQINYIGHSQGTTQMFYALAKSDIQNDLKNKIKLFIALAPIVSVGQDNIGLKMLCYFTRFIETILGLMKVYELFSKAVMTQFLRIILGPIGTFFCFRKLYIYQMTSDQLTEPERNLVQSNRYPSTNSAKCTIALGQVINSSKFQLFDYHASGNLEKYGLAQPSVINLSDIHTPIAMIVGEADDLASPKDALLTKQQLKNVIFYKEYQNLSHEMLLSRDMSYMQDVFELLKQNNKKVNL